MTPHATLRFYAELRDFLPADQQSGEVTRRFDVPGSVKDLIEACGVPHTEVDLVLANSRSVSFSHIVEGGDRISVYPLFESFDIRGDETDLDPCRGRRPAAIWNNSEDTAFLLDPAGNIVYSFACG